MMLQLRATPSSIARDAELYAMLYTQRSPDSWGLGWGSGGEMADEERVREGGLLREGGYPAASSYRSFLDE